MSLIPCAQCRQAVADYRAACPFCGASTGRTEGAPPAQVQPSLASREANARLAVGKRLRTEDRATLMAEAVERGEHVSGFDKAMTGTALVAKLGAAICTLIILCIVLYACAAAAIH